MNEAIDERERMVEGLEKRLRLQHIGWTDLVGEFPNGWQDKSDHGPTLVKLVVLETSGKVLAYCETYCESCGNWKIGSIEDVVDEILFYREQRELADHIAREQGLI